MTFKHILFIWLAAVAIAPSGHTETGKPACLFVLLVQGKDHPDRPGEPGFYYHPDGSGRVVYEAWDLPTKVPAEVNAEMHAYFEKKRDPSLKYNSAGKETDGEVGQHSAIVSDKGLKTSGLINCSAVMFRFKGKNFLMHVDLKYQSLKTLHEEIVKNFDLKELQESKDLKIIVNDGNEFNSYDTLQRIRTTLTALGLDGKIAYGGRAKDSLTYVGINEDGPYMYRHRFPADDPRSVLNEGPN